MNEVKRYLPLAVRVVLGGIFIYAAVTKIADPVAFAGNIAAYKILPYFWSYATAAALPWVELVSGVLLVTGFRVRGSALVIAVLNVVFIAALSSALARGLQIDCGCFKPGAAKGSVLPALLRDLVFLAMTLLVLKWEGTKGPEAEAEP